MMTPRILELHATERVSDALDRVRRCEPEVDAVYRLPVTDDGHFIGLRSCAVMSCERDMAAQK